MPVQRRKREEIIPTFLILLILIIDQFSKYLVCRELALGESIPLIHNILHITLVKNTGAAFGLFKNSTVIFIAVSIIAIFVILILILNTLRRERFLSKPIFNIGLILIASGALGNLVDRLRFSYVIDFIDVRVWPVFNIADMSITIGAFLLILTFIFRSVN